MITVDNLFIAHQDNNKSTLPNLEKGENDLDNPLIFLDLLKLDAKPISASWEEFEKRTLTSSVTTTM